MGSPDFAVPTLRALHDSHNVALVVCQPDKPAGRKQILTPCPVKEAAVFLGLNTYQPNSLRNDEAYETLKRVDADVAVVAAYGKILPKNILDLPRLGCVNVHGSLLPHYRGASPVQSAVLNGEKVTGLTTMLMDEGLDTGDILLVEKTQIDENETSGELFDRLADLAPALTLKTLEMLEAGTIERIRQDSSLATFCKPFVKDDAKLDFKEEASVLKNRIRAMNPWPVSFCFYEGKRLKVFTSQISDLENDCEPGSVQIIDGSLIVSCGAGTVLELKEVQLEGSKRMPAADFVKGHRPTHFE